MKAIFCVAVVVVIDIPDDDPAAGAPLANGPLDELAARLRREARYGRDCGRPEFTLPSVTAFMAAAYQECFDWN